jgi:hypothetical protein
VAKRKSDTAAFQSELAVLSRSIPEDLHLPSLDENRLEGFAHLFVIALPQLASTGERVFTDPILDELFDLLDNRFGGCMVPSSTSHPPFWGLWHPKGSPRGKAQKDYLTTVQVLARPTDAATRFFTQLKQILKTAGIIEQQEILISRTDCWLI